MADDEVRNYEGIIKMLIITRLQLQEAQRRREEKERKKAEVRKRLEESAKAKKGVKTGFLTPERKKKLRVSWCRRHGRVLAESPHSNFS